MKTGKTDITKSSEKTLEKKLKTELKKLGGKALKFHSQYETGWPDRIVLFNGRCWWVELKTTGESLQPRQRIVGKELQRLGFEVYKIDSELSLQGFINAIQE